VQSKQEIIAGLDEIFHHWLELIAGLTKEQIKQPFLPSLWTLKDLVAHLWSWQQGSVARAQAALNDAYPDYPDWWKACGPDPDEDVDRTNAYIFTINQDKDWERVYTDWKQQFEHYLDLLRQIPAPDLLQKGRYAWMGTYALADSALGSLDHHIEHYEDLTSWLQEHGA
jgi:hypothetical protein